MKTLLIVLAVVAALGAGFGGGFAAGRASAPDVPEVPEFTLPADAIKLSEVIPAMGEHWANPAKLPVGPIYLVHEGEVIGIEFMFNNDFMTEVTAGPETFLELAGLEVDTEVNHMSIEYLPAGHEGFLVPHYDVHLYFITPAERQELVP